MRRSLKYGLYAAVLAGVVGGTAAYTTASGGTPVTLIVDGHRSTVSTPAHDVAGVLAAQGFHVSGHDLVAPSLHSAVRDGSTIVYKRGRQLRLTVDGRPRVVWTTEPTVAGALEALGYPQADFVSVSRSRRLPLHATDLALRSPKQVLVARRGSTEHAVTTAATVGQLLRDLDITLGAHDRVQPSLVSAIAPGQAIRIERVVTREVSKRRHTAYPVVRHPDHSLYRGDTKVLRPGHKGIEQVSYEVVFVDGKLSRRSVVASRELRAPRTQVEKYGTRRRPQPKVSDSGLDWEAVAQCESGGDWHINTGNGFYGGLQFDLGTWDSNGGQQYASRPDLASKAQQIAIATKVYNARGSSPWPVCGANL